MTSQLPDRSATPPTRVDTRGTQVTARRSRRRTPTERPTTPPAERASGWLVALAVVGGAVLFSVLALNAFLGG